MKLRGVKVVRRLLCAWNLQLCWLLSETYIKISKKTKMTASSRQKGEGRLFVVGNLKNCYSNSLCENDASFSRLVLFHPFSG